MTTFRHFSFNKHHGTKLCYECNNSNIYNNNTAWQIANTQANIESTFFQWKGTKKRHQKCKTVFERILGNLQYTFIFLQLLFVEQTWASLADSINNEDDILNV